MFTSAELIEALRKRMRRSLRPEPPPGTFPPGWTAWFASMRERVGKVTGATADAIIAIFIAREPALPPRAALSLNRWQSFTTLWRQQWQPESRDGRGVRIFALAVTLLVHLMFAVFLVYLAYIRFMAATAPEAARAGEEFVVQVEFIGEGTPEDTGGGPPQEQAQADDTPAPSAKPATPATPVQRIAREPAAPAPSPQAAPAAPVEPPSQTQPAPAPPVEQPLQVTQTPAPDQAFILPPVRILDAPQPEVPTPDLSAPAPEIRIVDIPAPVRPVQPVLPRRITPSATAVPQLEQPTVDVRVRDIPAPLSPVRIRNDMPTIPVETPELEAGAPQITVRDIPAPPAATAPAAEPAQGQAGNATASKPATGTSPATGTASTRSTQTARSGTQSGQPATGSGTRPSPRPGALPSPKRGDDWSLSDRNRPGGQAGTPGGLFDADGSPNLVSGDGKVGGGLPPGTITEDFAKIDRHGTWLKRPPTDYEPTSFDKFWLPNESLLEEWVRRSVQTVLIPIPGTTKTITCSVVLLALGGACGISDPNLQDIEATARKPPDIPFKPELQENPEVLAAPPPQP